MIMDNGRILNNGGSENWDGNVEMWSGKRAIGQKRYMDKIFEDGDVGNERLDRNDVCIRYMIYEGGDVLMMYGIWRQVRKENYEMECCLF